MKISLIMASNSIETNAIAYIDEIYTLSKSSRFTVLIKTVNNFVQFLSANVPIIYSNVNRYFYKIGLAPVLMSYCIHLSNESVEGIFQLLHIFAKTNNNISELMRNSNTFMGYLSNILSKEYIWLNIDTFKYHIHLAAHVILDSTSVVNFDCVSVCKLITQTISKVPNSRNYIFLLISHACFIPVQKFDSMFRSRDDLVMEMPLTKVTVKTMTNLVEEYLLSFEKFYHNSENEHNQCIFFSLKSVFSFDQICHSICHYSYQCEQIYFLFVENGLFQAIAKIFLIKYIPQRLILRSLNILMIPSRYSKIHPKFGRENLQLCDALNYYLTNHRHSVEITQNITVIINLYWASGVKDVVDSLNTYSTDTVTFSSATRFSNERSISLSSGSNWDSTPFNVNDWLINNNIGHLCPMLSRLSWRGLYMLQTLVNEENGRRKVIELLTSRMDMDFTSVLELVECIENLSFI